MIWLWLISNLSNLLAWTSTTGLSILWSDLFICKVWLSIQMLGILFGGTKSASKKSLSSISQAWVNQSLYLGTRQSQVISHLVFPILVACERTWDTEFLWELLCQTTYFYSLFLTHLLQWQKFLKVQLRISRLIPCGLDLVSFQQFYLPHSHFE